MLDEIHSFAEYEGFIRSLSADPRYSDPHFTYNESNFYDALKDKNERAFAARRDGETVGLFVWLILPEDRFIELIIGFSRDANAWEEMLARMEKQYPGYQMDFVLNPKNDVLTRLLKAKNAAFETEQQKMVWVRDTPDDGICQVELLSPARRDAYRALHRTGAYWTAEKVLAAEDRFRVLLALRDDRVIGYLDVTHCHDENEPYDLFVTPEFEGRGYEVALLREAVRRNKPHRMMALVDVDAAAEIAAYESAGFEKAEGQNSVYATYKA